MSLLNMSFYGAVMILAVMVIRTMSLQRLPKKTFLILWGIVMLRLLIPLDIKSPLSIYTAANHMKPYFTTIGGAEVKNSSDAEPITAPILPQSGSVYQTEEQMTQTAYETANAGLNRVQGSLWIIIIWTAGFCGCFLLFFVPHIKCLRKYNQSLPVEQSLVGIKERGMQLKRKVQVRKSDRIQSPFTYGVLHPIILFPKDFDWENKERLDYVLTHEWMHIRHFDTLVKYILVITLSVHWFNPFVWMMYFLVNRDMEMICDESVLKILGENKKTSYAMALIEMEAVKSQRGLLYSGFSRNSVEERIYAIMKMKKRKKVVMALSVTLIASLAVAFSTSASEDAYLHASGETISSEKTVSKSTLRKRDTQATVSEAEGSTTDVYWKNTLSQVSDMEAYLLKEGASATLSEADGNSTDAYQKNTLSEVSGRETSVLKGESESSFEGFSDHTIIDGADSYLIQASENNDSRDKTLEAFQKKSLDELKKEYQKKFKTMDSQQISLEKLADKEQTFLNLKFQKEFDTLMAAIMDSYHYIADIVGVYGMKVKELESESKKYQTLNDEYYTMLTAVSKKLDSAERLQNKILSDTETERSKSYKELGITIENGNYYLNGERIAEFSDGYFEGKNTFSGTMSNDNKGTIVVTISRDKEGKVINLERSEVKD